LEPAGEVAAVDLDASSQPSWLTATELTVAGLDDACVQPRLPIWRDVACAGDELCRVAHPCEDAEHTTQSQDRKGKE
jgi:hypothetical protein